MPVSLELGGNFFKLVKWVFLTCILFYICYVDVFSCGIWSQFEGIEDDELRDLASSLPGVVLSGRAPATAKKYSGAFSRWKRWASTKQEVQVILAKPIFVVLYINYLLQTSKTNGPIEGAVNALSWAQWMLCPGRIIWRV